MSFLPIVERELRVSARNPRTYRNRMGYVLVSSLVAAVLLLGSDGGGQQLGNTAFPVLVNLALFFCLIGAVRHAADCLSEEKREGTLGFLFLTDLRGYDVVLGKLVAVSTRLFQGLFAFIPVLAVGLLLGGITVGEFWRVTVVLVNTLFFALCVALWVSAVSVRVDRALLAAALVLVSMMALPLIGDWLMALLFHLPRGTLAWASPIAAATLTSDLPYRAAPRQFWVALLLNHLCGWFFLLCASLALPRAWQNIAPARHRRKEAQFNANSSEAAVEAAQGRRQLLDLNPILWLAARNEGGRWLLWGMVTLVTLASVAGLLINQGLGIYTLGIPAVMQLGLGLVMKLWVAWRACATLAEARRSGAVELLLATPIKVEEIIHGHWQALQRFFFWPVVVASAAFLLPLVVYFVEPKAPAGTMSLWPGPAVALFGMATFFLDLVALAWVGMWMGLSQPRPVQAFAKTVLYAMIVPLLVFCLPNMVFDLFWISWARRKLEHEFRAAALERSMPAPMAISPPKAEPPVLPPMISYPNSTRAIDV